MGEVIMMRGFNILCNNCGNKLDLKAVIDHYSFLSVREKLDIEVDINHDGRIENIKCACGNGIEL